MKYYFPIHLDGGNRGCEGIAKGTSVILGVDKSNLIGYCSNVDLDNRLGIGNILSLKSTYKRTVLDKILFKLYCLFEKDELKQKEYFLYQLYHIFLDDISSNSLMLSTGGDMLCYGYNQAVFTVNYAKKKGIKSILWGCSIGEDNLTADKISALKNFSFIYVRESLTQKVLNSHGINNVFVFPDPAFFLKPEKCETPICFTKSDVIGINVSNYVMGGFCLNSDFAKEIIKLIDYILKTTKMRILLVPHVLWKEQDDRIVSKLLKEYFHDDRITILNSDNLNYCQIRYIISKCKMFIGGRTHAVISAYSMCVPTIALGYSIKSIGIAHDLGLPEWSVVDSKHCKRDALLDSFKLLVQNREDIKIILENYMHMFELNRNTIIRDIHQKILAL